MKKEKKSQEDPEIELVSIEDLRTAMGGVTLDNSPQLDPLSPVASTSMCSGWSGHIPGPDIYF